jgi:hypothetical protein
MRRYRPITNPNNVPAGTIQRSRNGLYWVSTPISITNNNTRTWELYDGVPMEHYGFRHISVIPPYNELNSNISDISHQIPNENLLDGLNELTITNIPNIPNEPLTPTSATNPRSSENTISDSSHVHPRSSENTISDSSHVHPRSLDTTSDSTHVHPRTTRDNISYTDSNINDQEDIHGIYHDIEIDSNINDQEDISDTESDTESNYNEDSDDYTNVSSDSDSITDDKVELLSKCLNDSPITLLNYNETDLNQIFVIYIQNQQGKFVKGSCLRRDEMTDILESDIDNIPTYIMSIYKTPSSNNHHDLLTGMTSKPTGKIIVRIPTNQIYVTFGSLKKILSTPNKEWYALPLYGGNPRRVGNLQGLYGNSMNHGQVPGFQIYKLFTKRDIENNVISQETPDDFPHVYHYDTMKSLFELIGETPINIFIQNIVNELIPR